MPEQLFSNKVIAVVDDSEDNLFLFENILAGSGYKNIHCFRDPSSVLQTLEQKNLLPNIFLLDIMMPVLDGISLCRQIRKLPQYESSSVVFVTAWHGDDALQQAYDAGSQDFLRKPFSKLELLCRLKSIFMIQDLNLDLRLKNQELTYTSITDGLTELYNRAFLDKRLKEEFDKCFRYKHKMSMLMMDIDFFKNVNDRYGHPVGDEVLKCLAQELKDTVRASDLLARYGGEEIALLMSGISMNQAVESAERIREKVAELSLSKSVPELRITLSIGVAEYCHGMEDPEQLIKHADKALYEAKHRGRNQVRAWIAEEKA